MRIENFEMERMQSTWENVVEMDMSESGVRPVSLRELGAMGLDLESILDMPLGYCQSNGTIALRENLAALYPGATPDHIEVTNGTSEANYLLALALLREGKPARLTERKPEEERAFHMLGLLTALPVLYVCNVDEASAANGNEFARKVTARAKEEGAAAVVIQPGSGLAQAVLGRRRHVVDVHRALERVIANPSLRVSLGEAGWRLWADQFTARAMAARTVQVYEKALACA